MRHLLVLKKHLQKELNNLERTLKETKIARDNSPSAMESSSDMSRSKHEGAVLMLEQMKKEKERFLSKIPTNNIDSKTIEIWSFTEINFSDNKMKVVIVPEGLGGIKISGLQYVSDCTPLGTVLIGKKRGESFSFNNLVGMVVSVNG